MSNADCTSENAITLLRQELKAWEKSFAAANGGRKAGRDDIKKDAGIGAQSLALSSTPLCHVLIDSQAAKYREYDRLRRPPSQPKKPQPPPSEPTRPSRREHITATPQKPTSQLLPSPPVPAPQEQEDLEIEPTPAAVRMHLGPTPQKNGQILSLFDILSSAGSATPSKRNNPSRHALAAIEANIANTPSKSSTTIEESPAVRGSRTPASSGKRFLLDTFATPLKRKRDDDEETGESGGGTPSSAKRSEGSLATPAFLRRSSNMLILDTLVEEAEQEDDAVARIRLPPFKRKGGLVRSLSTIIRGLRQQEDDRLDEEMEMMREMEEESFAPLPRKPEPQQPHQRDREAGADVLVEDSQIAMPLGPDRGYESSESEEEAAPGRDGKPRKPWKKKGLKRQTKRVISMFFLALSSPSLKTKQLLTNSTVRPVTHKPKPSTAQQDPTGTSDSEDAADTAIVPETQLAAPLDMSSDSESDFSASESQARKKLKKLPAPVVKDVVAAAGSNGTEKEEGVVKKAAKKISASAHANFRKLKIKNQNSKAGGRRFGKR